MIPLSRFPQFVEARVERCDDAASRKMQSLCRKRVESRKHLSEKYARFARQMQMRRYGKLRKEYHTREDAAFMQTDEERVEGDAEFAERKEHFARRRKERKKRNADRHKDGRQHFDATAFFYCSH